PLLPAAAPSPAPPPPVRACIPCAAPSAAAAYSPRLNLRPPAVPAAVRLLPTSERQYLVLGVAWRKSIRWGCSNRYWKQVSARSLVGRFRALRVNLDKGNCLC